VQDYKTQARFLGKRDRIIREGWRHGIVGVDDADSATTQVFYQTQKERKTSMAHDKDAINHRR